MRENWKLVPFECRYSEAVQGKELERMFKEEGVIDDGDDDIDDNEVVIDKTLEHVTANNHEGSYNLSNKKS